MIHSRRRSLVAARDGCREEERRENSPALELVPLAKIRGRIRSRALSRVAAHDARRSARISASPWLGTRSYEYQQDPAVTAYYANPVLGARC